MMEELEKFESIILESEQDTGLAWLILNSGPHGMSTITSQTMKDIRQALDLLEEDPDVRVLIIKGEGKRAFSAGADISTFRRNTLVSTGESSRRGQTTFGRFETFPRQVIAAIRGFCLGGGLELAMACDFRIASASAQLGLPETNLGLLPGWGGTQRMTKLLGAPKTKELIMLGERLNAEQALEIGLVNKVVPEHLFEEEVRAFALKLAERPPIALNLAKKAINIASGSSSNEAGLEAEARSFAVALQTEDAKEGIESFFAKRKPVFKGK
jgi:enoyl-CoA hydratase / 3-hydroxyacyl-CoA dehydrogenase